jgi:hypothetical protein
LRLASSAPVSSPIEWGFPPASLLLQKPDKPDIRYLSH